MILFISIYIYDVSPNFVGLVSI